MRIKKCPFILFFVIFAIVGCNTTKIENVQNHNFFKMMSVDTSTFLDYNFMIIENGEYVFYLISKKDSIDYNNQFIDTLKKGRSYSFNLSSNDSLKILKLKNKSNPIDEYIYKKRILWMHDTIRVKTYFSQDIKGIFLLKKESR
jgi:hypothetical protein